MDGFLLSRQASGKTVATIGWYEARLARLVTHLHDPELRAIEPDQIRRWLMVVKHGHGSEPVSDNYVESHRRAAATFFRWALGDELVKVNPMRTVTRYKIVKREMQVLSPDEVRRLMTEQPTTTHEGIRNRAMIAFLYDTGVRVGELVHIELEKVDLVAGTVQVFGKSRKWRTVPISPPLRSLLWHYINAARPRELFSASTRLFLSRDGSSMRETAVNQWLRRAGKRAGIEQPVHPHKFRHSFATAWLRNDGDPLRLQLILGHETSDMTREYVHLVAADTVKAHQSASPLERLGRT